MTLRSYLVMLATILLVVIFRRFVSRKDASLYFSTDSTQMEAYAQAGIR